MYTHRAIVSDKENTFKCGLMFGFNPPICVQSAPKVERLFLSKGLDKCKKIAKEMGFEFVVLEIGYGQD